MRYVILLALLGACSKATETYSRSFAKCWGFRRNSEGNVETSLTAMIYPNAGVIAYNRKCPSRRLSVRFRDKHSSQVLILNDVADINGLQPTAFNADAVIEIDSVQRDDFTLRITVLSLENATILPMNETRKLYDEMNRVN